MNKDEFSSFMSLKKNISKKAAEGIINTFFETVIQALEEGQSVNLVGFASFSQQFVPERKGINPQDLKPMTIPAYTSVKIKPGQKLKDAVKNSQHPAISGSAAPTS